MQRFNSSHTYWWLCLCTWFGLSMSMWQAISLTLLTWTTLKCHLSKEMYNDYLHNIIITYFIKCHNMSSDWIYLYANIIDISIFVIFWYDILCQHEFDGHPVHTVMQTSMWPHCVLTAWGLWTPFRVFSDLQVWKYLEYMSHKLVCCKIFQRIMSTTLLCLKIRKN